MSLIRRRYYFWLFKAYIKRWYKIILSSVIVGIAIFFGIVFFLNFYLFPLIQKKVQKIGYSGVYTSTNIPDEVLQDVSYGLTRVNPDGTITPAAAFKWEIKNGGKEYVFHIKKGQYFHNNKELTAENLEFNFKDVNKKVIDDYTVSLSLKEAYAPFLASVAKPLFDSKLSGLGQYKVKNIDLNAGFVRSITLQNKDNSSIKKIINFYPTQDALKVAYSLGDVDVAMSVIQPNVKGLSVSEWANTKVESGIDYASLVTLFYNNEDSDLSNKKVRQALNYSLPVSFPDGERAYSPIPPNSIYFSKSPNYGISDTEIAQDLIDESPDVKKKTLIISTPEEYKKTATIISDAWKKIGIKSEIKIITDLTQGFQILLYPVKIPVDPDQYTLWHSSQPNNIIKYKNLRIDKLLEDGRSITDQERRISIYSDFQKYLIDDVPASFLYFPNKHKIIRK